jgi:L-lysine 6-transaminase
MVRFGRHLEIIEEERLVDNARDVGTHLLAGVQELQQQFPQLVSNARGRGLMCAFDLPEMDVRDRFRQEAFKNALLILGCGERSIRFRPTLSVSREDCDRGLEVVRRCLETVAGR